MNNIYKNEKIRNGKFIFKGTRIAVEDIVESLLYGLSIDEIIEEYPSITKEHLNFFLKFVKNLFRSEINFLQKNLNSQKDIEKLYKYKGCLNFIEKITLKDLQSKNAIQNPEMKLCLKSFLVILKKYQSKKDKYEIFVR